MLKIFFTFAVAVLSVCNINAEIIDSGTCGNNLTWTFTNDGTLIVSGTGAMTDYYEINSRPWTNYISSITEVVIENSVTTVGYNAFKGCMALSSLTLGNSVSIIGPDAFWNTDLTTVTIPASVTEIHEYAFSGNLNTVNFNATNCTAIYSSFEYTLISAINFGNNVQSIPQYAFQNCRYLTSITIPNSVTSIGQRAFYGCSAVTSITIGSMVNDIGERAFASCNYLTEVHNHSVTPQNINSNVFEGLFQGTALYVPECAVEVYQNTLPWSNFSNITGEGLPCETGINEISEKSISIYVNDNYLFINLENNILKIEIFTVAGNLIISDNVFDKQINVSHLLAGVYLLKINTDKGIKTGKFIKY
jgi:hypothetical protein